MIFVLGACQLSRFSVSERNTLRRLLILNGTCAIKIDLVPFIFKRSKFFKNYLLFLRGNESPKSYVCNWAMDQTRVL